MDGKKEVSFIVKVIPLTTFHAPHPLHSLQPPSTNGNPVVTRSESSFSDFEVISKSEVTVDGKDKLTEVTMDTQSRSEVEDKLEIKDKPEVTKERAPSTAEDVLKKYKPLGKHSLREGQLFWLSFQGSHFSRENLHDLIGLIN